jgi:antagonist of KipI
MAEFLKETMITITGGNLLPKMNGNPVPMWQGLNVHQGDILSFTSLKSGLRSYIAIQGGINVPLVLGSRSTYIRSHLGGFHGRTLCKDDYIHDTFLNTSLIRKIRNVPRILIPSYNNQITLRVVAGTEQNSFTREGINTFFSSEYTVLPQSDRTGYRLKGEKVTHRANADIISDGIPPGAIQIPGDEMPILLLADHQTIGGYTKIATAISVDLPYIAQAKPGDKVRFKEVSITHAHELLHQQEMLITQFAHDNNNQ